MKPIKVFSALSRWVLWNSDSSASIQSDTLNVITGFVELYHLNAEYVSNNNLSHEQFIGIGWTTHNIYINKLSISIVIYDWLGQKSERFFF